MGISSSLNAGVSGLNANANKLATISDNIANSQTYGYKRADVDFASLAVSDSRTPYTAGGGRWFTAGGVKTNAIWDIDAKGALATTANATDLAITGRGMLPVTSLSSLTSIGPVASEPDFMMTSTGSFQADANGYLRTPSRAGAARLAGRSRRRDPAAAARQRLRADPGADQPRVVRRAADVERSR